jgi:hypothetical protein
MRIDVRTIFSRHAMVREKGLIEWIADQNGLP